MNPNPLEVRALRERVQAEKKMQVLEAQAYCAAAIHAGRRSWQHWEAADRKMHPAFWELAQLKLNKNTQKRTKNS